MQSATKPAPNRILSIDVLRGLTIALMILVNDPGDWSHVYSQLDHAEWNGFTLTDFVFPNFLFIVGASIVFSTASRMARGDCRLTLTGHLFRRAFTIFAIKMFLTAFPHFHLTHLRIFGVLTRIAICYLVAGLICLAVWNTRHRARILAAITAALLIGYWALMRFVPVPGLGVPTQSIPLLDPDRNLAAWLDRGFNSFTRAWLHTGNLYNHTRDPEGLLSTLPAIATTLIGCLTGLWLTRASQIPSSRPEPRSGAVEGPAHLQEPSSRPEPRSGLMEGAAHLQEPSSRPEPRSGAVEGPPYLSLSATITRSKAASSQTLRILILSGLVTLALGLLWSHTFPLNKNLWTSSFVLFAAGWSLLLLSLCYWLIDIRQLNQNPAGKWLLRPWLIFGSNAITAFIISNFLVELTLWVKVPAGALPYSIQPNPANPTARISAWLWPYLHIFARHGSTKNTSLAFALAFTALCFLPNWILWRKKIFLKV